MRHLASIQRVNGVYPIEGRDRIVQYGINGWRVIDQVGRYEVGDLVVYLEVDSWVPNSLAPFLSRDKGPRVFENVPGERLKTMKMGGAMSQGLLLPLSVLHTPEGAWPAGVTIDEDVDVTEILGVLKWERSPEFRAANARGDFPHFIRKTDQERVQNVRRASEVTRRTYEMTEKLEGQSFTAFIFEDEVGVCSRNLQLKMDEPSTWLDTFNAYDLETKLRHAREILGVDLAFQGEQIGPGIEGNIYGLSKVQLYIFGVWNIHTQKYLLPTARRALLEMIDLPSVPYLGEVVFGDGDDGMDIQTIRDDMLKMAFRKSALAPVVAEGVVLQSNEDDFSFKAVSNEYLLNDKKPTPWRG